MDVISEIQPGWEVVSSEGEKVGKVIDVSEGVVHVKQSGFFGGEVHLPPDTIAEAEESTVRLSLSKRELEAGAG
jgi:hypothetical protein